MTTIPTGAPAWLRTNNFVTYGGDPNKKNFASRGLINPKTDVGAEGFSRMVSDVAAFTRTAEFCVMRVLIDDGGGTLVLVESCRIMTGTAVSYRGTPPTGFPAVTQNGVGDVTIVFPASLADEYGVVGSVALRDPVLALIGTTAGVAVPEMLSDTSLRVRCVNLSGVAVSNAHFSLTLGSGG